MSNSIVTFILPDEIPLELQKYAEERDISLNKAAVHAFEVFVEKERLKKRLILNL